MKTFTFVIKEPKQEISALVLIIRDAHQKISISTKIKEKVSAWDIKSQSFTRESEFFRLNNELVSKWTSVTMQVIREDALNPLPLSEVRNKILSIMQPDKVRESTYNLFLPYFKKWATTSTTQRTATRQLLYSYNLFGEFAGKRKLSFADITYNLCEEYITWMCKKGLSVNTRGGHVKRIKSVMREAENQGLHNNKAYLLFRREQEDVDNIYLTDDELLKIEELQLCGSKLITRDLFLIGCYTAMRFSDYSRLSILDISDGMIRQVQKKTKERVVIPVHPTVKRIIDKYGGAPKISQQKFNSIIKDVCRQAGLTQRVQIAKNGQICYFEKWELVSSHTARRTAATNMFKAGIPTISIMKITGHKTEANFMRYIKISKEENAKIIAENSFFKE